MLEQRRYRSARRTSPAIIGAISLWCTIAAVVTIAVLRERQLYVRQAEQVATSMTAVMEESTARTFQTVDMALETVQSTLASRDVAPDDPAVRQMMRAQLAHMPTVRALFVVGADGFVQHDTDFPKTPHVPLADRSYFRAYLADPALETSISEPLRSRSGTGWFIAISRRIQKAGQFRGIVVAAVQLDYVGKLYQQMGLSKGYVIALFHKDGRLLARFPPDEASVGRSFASYDLFTTYLKRRAADTLTIAGPPLGYERVLSYRAVNGLPLVVTLSEDKAAILALWTRTAVGAAIALVCLLPLAVWVLQQYLLRQRVRLEAVESAQSAAQAMLLAQANAKFKAFFQQACFFACVLDVDGEVLETCHANLQTRHRQASTAGRKLWEQAWWSADDAALIEDGVLAAAAGETRHVQVQFIDSEGAEGTLELTLTPVRDPGQAILFVAVHGADLRAHKRAEQELRQLADRLALSDESKSVFMATLSHELRNMLSPLRNSVTLLDRGTGQPDIVPKARAIIERQLRHIERLVSDLLDLSRAGSGKLRLDLQRLDMRIALGCAVEATEHALTLAGHVLTTSLPDEALWVWADDTRLTQIFSNLLSNAVKYTPAGGRLDVRAYAAGDTAVVEVRDSGLGIPPEALPKIFNLYEQVTGHLTLSQGGLGIGLALVRQLVELHGGQVRAESDGPGHGSTFFVSLPLLPEVPEAPGSLHVAAAGGAPAAV
jgi:signal transduction histidine kinase